MNYVLIGPIHKYTKCSINIFEKKLFSCIFDLLNEHLDLFFYLIQHINISYLSDTYFCDILQKYLNSMLLNVNNENFTQNFMIELKNNLEILNRLIYNNTKINFIYLFNIDEKYDNNFSIITKTKIDNFISMIKNMNSNILLDIHFIMPSKLHIHYSFCDNIKIHYIEDELIENLIHNTNINISKIEQYRNNLYDKIFNFNPYYSNAEIYVYCSGKSGSSTLLKTFKDNYIECCYCHNSKDFSKRVNLDNIKYNTNFDNNIFNYINHSISIYKDIYFIDSYRLPLERSISSFFEGIEKICPEYKTKDITQLINLFNSEYYNCENYWSIDEICKYFNIEKFNSLEKYNYKTFSYKSSTIHLILLDFSYINEWQEILNKIMNKNIVLLNNNTSKEKLYYDIYNKFKKEYYITEYMIDYYLQEEHFLQYNSEVNRIIYKNKLLSLIK